MYMYTVHCAGVHMWYMFNAHLCLQVTHFWPACDSTMIHVAVDMGRGESTGYSCPFNYKKSDFLVLQLNEPVCYLYQLS